MTAVKPSQYHSVLLTQIKVYFNLCLDEEATIIAHLIRIFDISAWVRNSNLTHVILPRMSCEGCILVVLRINVHVWKLSHGCHCNIKVT